MPNKPISALVKLLLLAPASVGGWLAYSRFLVNHHLTLPPAINAPRRTFVGRHGSMSYYMDTSTPGRPLVLIHSINAAASAYELRPIFEHYRTRRPVFALDLPGFGFSERSDMTYSPRLYADSIKDFLDEVPGEAPDVIALSLGSEFAAWAALEAPDRIHSLTMISPSGFTSRTEKVASQRAGDTGFSDTAYEVFSNPLWSRAFYDLLTTRPSIRYFLKKSFVGPVDEGLVDYDYLTAHQPGAHYAPLYFVSGKLFTRDVLSEVYQKLELPMLVIYDRDSFVRFDLLPDFASTHPNWHLARIAPTLGLPQFENMSRVAEELDRFWSEVTVIPSEI
jgi:pimeloyl-ACP methyl ester carboxylesterase